MSSLPPHLVYSHHAYNHSTLPAMTSTEAPIGASVIDYIERNSASSSVDDKRQASASLETTDVSQAAESASIPSAPPSLIACNKSCNVLLKGVPQSGLSSIAMNMAHSIASSSTQYCQGACGGSTSSCTCVAVSILTPLSNNPTRESFPMSCHLVESSPPLDFYGQLRALQQQQENDNNNTASSVWNKAALRRIQVHRMATIRNVMEYLLNIQSNCPTGGILLQDLDVFVRGNSVTSNANKELSTEQLMTMTQILALLADTANTVRHSLPPSCPFSVLVTMTANVPWNVHRLWCTWFSTILKIQSNKSWKAPLEQDEDESVESTFVIQDESMGEEQSMVAHYAIVRQNNGCFRIVWKRGNE